MEKGLTRNQVISMLTKSPHGDLAQYAPVGLAAASEDPEFYAHLVAWNARKGSIRDAKVALPVLALASQKTDEELRENALAHIVSLDPRNLVRALRFSKGQPILERRRLYRTIERSLREREANKARFDRNAMQHRASLRELYALLHVKPGNAYQRGALGFRSEPNEAHPKGMVLPPQGVFAVLGKLKDMDPAAAAGAIIEHKIPFLAARGALGEKFKDPAVVQALLGAMSPTEVVTNAKAFEGLGVKTNPALRSAFEAALAKAAESTKAALKTTKAAEAIGGKTAEQLRGVQEKQLDKMSVEGDWLIMADKSSSMAQSIEAARQIAALLVRVTSGSVHLIYYNTAPAYYNVTGKSLDEITKMTARITATGGTVPGCALAYAQANHLPADGIVYVADCNENYGAAPRFTDAYKAYCASVDKDVPLYAYQLAGDPPNMLDHAKAEGIDIQVLDLRGGVDFYSLPNLISTMRTNRYSLSDEIMATPLLKLSDVFKLAA